MAEEAEKRVILHRVSETEHGNVCVEIPKKKSEEYHFYLEKTDELLHLGCGFPYRPDVDGKEDQKYLITPDKKIYFSGFGIFFQSREKIGNRYHWECYWEYPESNEKNIIDALLENYNKHNAKTIIKKGISYYTF